MANDATIGCKAPNNSIKLIDFELDLEQELDEFKSSFEWDELKETWFNFFVLYIFEMWSHTLFRY